MESPRYTPVGMSTSVTAYLEQHWADADKQVAELPAETAPELERWREMQARAREDRVYTLVSRAVFSGTIKAHLVLIIVTGALAGLAVALVNR